MSNSSNNGGGPNWVFENMFGIDEQIEEAIEANKLRDISNDIFRIYIWVVVAIGVPGNILTIITILTMQQYTPATFFISLLALCDGSALVSKLIAHQLTTHRAFGPYGCKVLDFSSSYLATTANWVLVLICVERFISVLYPLKKNFILTKKRSYVTASILMGTFFVFYATVFFLMRTATDQGECTTKTEYRDFWIDYWYVISSVFYLIIPFLCVAILTGLVVRGLLISRKDRRSLMRKDATDESGDLRATLNNQRRIEECERLETMIAVMIIAVAAVFLILTLPACVYFLAYDYKTKRSVLVQARWNLFLIIQYVCADSSHAINFLLYFLMAKRFRVHLFKMITCKARKSANIHTKSSGWTQSSTLSHTPVSL